MFGNIIKTIYELIARLQFWWVKRTLKLGVHFDFIKGTDICVILKGRHAGVTFVFENMRVEDDSHGSSCMSFRTVVKSIPDDVKISETSFNRLTSNIVRVLLSESVAEKGSIADEIREDDIVELDEEREIRTESPSVPEAGVPKRNTRKKSVSNNSELHTELQQPTKRKRTQSRTRNTVKSNRK
jgi:hypothetical protein